MGEFLSEDNLIIVFFVVLVFQKDQKWFLVHVSGSSDKTVTPVTMGTWQLSRSSRLELGNEK